MGYGVNLLVSNVLNVAAFRDTNLLNPIGLDIDRDTNTLWVADNGKNMLTSYDFQGRPLSVPVLVLGGNPTGLEINYTRGFVVSNGRLRAAALLVVATERGTINAYNPDIDLETAFVMVDNSPTGAFYTGLTIADKKLYVADFANNKVDVFNFNFNQLSGFTFKDCGCPEIPCDFAPFNIKNLNGRLYVTYAKRCITEDGVLKPIFGDGCGYINEFDYDGRFVRRLVTMCELNAPYGLSFAPRVQLFGEVGDYLLVGNVGNGIINVYDIFGKYMGCLRRHRDKHIILEGLWSLLEFRDTVMFTSGPSCFNDGFVGYIYNKDRRRSDNPEFSDNLALGIDQGLVNNQGFIDNQRFIDNQGFQNNDPINQNIRNVTNVVARAAANTAINAAQIAAEVTAKRAVDQVTNAVANTIADINANINNNVINDTRLNRNRIRRIGNRALGPNGVEIINNNNNIII